MAANAASALPEPAAAPVAGVATVDAGVPASPAPVVGDTSGRGRSAFTVAPAIREFPGRGRSSAWTKPVFSATVLFVKGTTRWSE